MMINRRTFIQRLFQSSAGIFALSLVQCAEDNPLAREHGGESLSDRGELILYDTYAMALYFDGTMGPKTGVIKVEYLLNDVPVEMEFWHGHGGKQHRYVVTPAHFSEIKQMKKVTVQTTNVEGHSHKLFIDFHDPRWRVPGAQPIAVPVPLLNT